MSVQSATLSTETWLNECSDFMYEIPGYRSINYYRMGRNGGGMKLYYLEHVYTVKSELMLSESCEFMMATSTIPGLVLKNYVARIGPPKIRFPIFYLK